MSDIAVNITNRVPNGSVILNKPSYLITLEGSNKKEVKYFLTIEKPELLSGFVQAKGLFVENSSREEISSNYTDLITNAKKELLLEMLFPWHKVSCIRSLVFRAK